MAICSGKRKLLAALDFNLKPSLVENSVVAVRGLANAICQPAAYALASLQTSDIVQTNAGGSKTAALNAGAPLPNTRGF